MNQEIVEKLLSTGRRKYVVAAAKLGSRLARKSIKVLPMSPNMGVADIVLILREAGYREDVADVMIGMSLLRSLIPQYFEIFSEQAHTDIHSAALAVMESLENWMKDPCAASTDRVFTQQVELHRALLTSYEHREDQEESEVESSEDDSDEVLCDMEERGERPEDALYEALREICRLTSPIERDGHHEVSPSRGIALAMFSVEDLQQMMTPPADRRYSHRETHTQMMRGPSRLLTGIRQNLVKQLLSIP